MFIRGVLRRSGRGDKGSTTRPMWRAEEPDRGGGDGDDRISVGYRGDIDHLYEDKGSNGIRRNESDDFIRAAAPTSKPRTLSSSASLAVTMTITTSWSRSLWSCVIGTILPCTWASPECWKKVSRMLHSVRALPG